MRAARTAAREITLREVCAALLTLGVGLAGVYIWLSIEVWNLRHLWTGR